jgi:hypothetical protein
MIIFLSDITFNSLWQRPQEFAVGLSKVADVIFVEPSKAQTKYRHLGATLSVLSIPMWHFNSRYAIVRRISYYLSPYLNWLMRWIQVRALKPYVKDDSLYLVESVQFAHLAKSRLIFDIIDQYDGFCPLPRWMHNEYRRTVARADAITVTHQGLAPSRDAHLIPNAADTKLFKKRYCVYGYVGVIGDYMDWGYIEDILKNENNCVIMVGQLKTTAPNLKNLLILPPVKHELLPTLMRIFDVGIIPFKETRLTKYVDPVKQYEYGAAGLSGYPVVDWSERLESLKRVILMMDGKRSRV